MVSKWAGITNLPSPAIQMRSHKCNEFITNDSTLFVFSGVNGQTFVILDQYNLVQCVVHTSIHCSTDTIETMQDLQLGYKQTFF